MTRVKVCGITQPADVQVAAAAGADAVGIICDVPVETPREVDVERARELAAGAPPFVTTVLVTMPRDPERAAELVDRIQPDAIQLHGAIEPDAVATVRANLPVDVLLAIDAADLDDANRFDDVVDGFVVDSTDEHGGGGTGETHDWERTRDETADLDSPVVLAGGLTSDNVADAVEAAAPFGVDVASGVESSGGVKDHDAVRSFVANAKARRETAGAEP
ncbi:phosphoribosylanthranilate isomerase [Halobacteria archaeon AArc-dxtr1]|nr:phosphoribosylanthranilate isomerase [Halobacteria archaeon AArc-dxtr1]